MAVMQLKTETFDSEALAGDKTVLVDFYADWCGPCKMMAPTVEEIADENPNVKVCKLNVDEASEIASRYGVMSIPTLMIFKNGAQVGKLVGVQSKDAVLKLIV